MLQKIRYFLFLAAVLIVIVVAFQNQQEVDIDILFFSRRYPLTLLLLASSAVSFLLGSLWMAWRSRKREKAKTRAETAKSKSGPANAKHTPPAAAPDAVDEITGDAAR